jgi:hypothetical protein
VSYKSKEVPKKIWEYKFVRKNLWVVDSDISKLTTPSGFVLSPSDAIAIYRGLLHMKPLFNPICLYIFKGSYVIGASKLAQDGDQIYGSILINGATGEVWDVGRSKCGRWGRVGFTVLGYNGIKKEIAVGSDMSVVFNTLGESVVNYTNANIIRWRYLSFSNEVVYISVDMNNKRVVELSSGYLRFK